MRLIDADAVHEALDYAALAEDLRQMFARGCELPVRHHHTVHIPGASDGTLLIMPAWQEGEYLGIKSMTVFPGNAAGPLDSVLGVYLLLDGKTGRPLAVIDGPALTHRRTAAASALAAQFLARSDASRLLLVGAGSLAPHLARAHARVRPVGEIRIWNRAHEAARSLAATLAGEGLPARATEDLQGAVQVADIISCATLATQPLVKGAWLKAGAHLDLVGGFRPDMREVDDDAIRRARLFVDTRQGALAEAGDIVDPLRRHVISEDDIVADLFQLSRGERRGRERDAEITLFKSVGTALEDLAAAVALIRQPS